MFRLKQELKGALILTILMVVVAVLFWSPETSLFFVSAIGFHELGHMIPILILGVPAYLTVAIWGVATVSDGKQRSRLSEFVNGLIHLGGPAFNLAYGLVALVIYANDESKNEYWLRLANTNALIGFVNILVLGRVSDGGKFIHRLYSSVPEWMDNAILVLVSMISIGTLAVVAVYKGPASVVWLFLIGGWIVTSLFRADAEDDASEVPPRAMNRLEQMISLVLYLALWVALLWVLIETPFLITQAQAIVIVEHAIWSVIMILTNWQTILLVVLFFVSLTLPHELGHWLMGLRVGIRTKRLVLGSPNGDPWLKFVFAGMPFELYAWPVMAAVETDDEDLRTAGSLRISLFAIAGPLVNILLAFAVLALSMGVHETIGFLAFVTTNMIQLVGSFLFGWLGWFGGSQFFFEAFGPINAMASNLGVSQLAVTFAVVQVFVAVVNLLPIPGLDGGWILMSLVIRLRTGFEPPERLEAVSRAIYNAWISFATKRMLKVIIGGSALLSIVHFGLYYFA